MLSKLVCIGWLRDTPLIPDLIGLCLRYVGNIEDAFAVPLLMKCWRNFMFEETICKNKIVVRVSDNKAKIFPLQLLIKPIVQRYHWRFKITFDSDTRHFGKIQLGIQSVPFSSTRRNRCVFALLKWDLHMIVQKYGWERLMLDDERWEGGFKGELSENNFMIDIWIDLAKQCVVFQINNGKTRSSNQIMVEDDIHPEFTYQAFLSISHCWNRTEVELMPLDDTN